MKKTESTSLVKVDIHMVLTLKALFDTGQVSRAAAALGVTQPTVSQTLRRMREYFGDPLFVRVGNALRPTPRAIELQASVDRVSREIDLMSQRPPSFDPLTSVREFVVSMTDIAELLGLSRAIGAFTADAPHCSLRSVRAPAHDVHRLLEDGQLDLAFGSYSSINETLRQVKLGDYDLVCCTAHGRLDSLTADAYLGAKHVVVPRFGEPDDYAAGALKKLGLTRQVVLRLPNHVAALAAVGESGLIATVPRHVATALAGSYPIRVRDLPMDLGRVSSFMVWHERFHNDPSHQWLRGILSRNYPLPGRGIGNA
jgi:LysR family transcriptional activator of mexEF-oprN operon